MTIRINIATALFVSLVPGIVSCSDDNNSNTPDEPSGPGIAKITVVDYSPAPGQFVNEIPEYTAGDNKAAIIAKAQAAIDKGQLVSLGAFGGSITFKLDKPIIRSLDGSPEFRVLGNTFLSTAENAPSPWGSSEPGIVMVMTDTNNNGQPDDNWYILAGESFDQAVETTVTYTDNPAAGDNAKFVRWEDNHGNSGWLSRNYQYHKHGFFPQWTGKNTMTVTGVRLPDNASYDDATQTYRLHALRGYADSYPNTSDASKLSLYNARTASGEVITVQRVDFVRIVTGVLQNNGALGECSTEVAGIEIF